MKRLLLNSGTVWKQSNHFTAEAQSVNQSLCAFSAFFAPLRLKKLLIFLFSICFLILSLAACGGAPKSQPQTSPSPAPQTPTVNVVTVESHELNRQLRLPGELLPFEDVAIYAKVQSFVEQITVDRGSVVKRGQLLARLRAPELDAQRSEAEARVSSIQSQKVEAQARVASIRAQRVEAEARLAAEEATFKRLKAASATPGVVAGNDVEIAERAVESARARVQALSETERAALAQVKTLDENERALKEAARSASNIESYLRITAPFDGVITERNVPTGPRPKRRRSLFAWSSASSSRRSMESSPNATRILAVWLRRLERRCCACNKFRGCDWSSLFPKPRWRALRQAQN